MHMDYGDYLNWKIISSLYNPSNHIMEIYEKKLTKCFKSFHMMYIWYYPSFTSINKR